MNLGGTVHLNRMGICVVFFCFLIVALYMTRDVHEEEPKKLPSYNVKQLLIAAIELAEKGGVEVFNVRKSADLKIQSKGKTLEGANNPVTDADYHSHCVMYFGLKKLFPLVKIISEEEVLESKCGQLSSPSLTMKVEPNGNIDNLIDEELPIKDLTIWIDPLDATQEFTENLLEYVTTLICVAYKGRPLVGVVHRPFAQEKTTSWAWVGRGMSSDLASYQNVESSPTVVVSRSHSGSIEDIVHKALGTDTPIVKAGGAGYKVLQVVSGNASAYVHATAIKKWDICAGNAILSAVGGAMTTLTNEEIDYSPPKGPLNRDGLLATRHDHSQYALRFHQALQRDMHL
ncbi:putative inositol monophosphatase 3 [Macrosteles quadrilineatus]|uniref:putative inositol monophosphatase 3 n=1 Tax=Macrosteles quadrilineatus TaxID=74068 RepID=UPI0023E0A8D7|nr:putative inositol monophosphatase 3 [Macrosteles quadrilineatus]